MTTTQTPTLYRPHTEVTKGEMVTTHLELGGIGIGYLQPDGEVYITTGSYFAVNAKRDIAPMISFSRDGGAGYRTKVRELVGW